MYSFYLAYYEHNWHIVIASIVNQVYQVKWPKLDTLRQDNLSIDHSSVHLPHFNLITHEMELSPRPLMVITLIFFK